MGMKMHVFYNGVQCIDKSLMVAGYGQMTYNNPVSTAELIRIPMQTFLFEHEDGLVLFDTGPDPEWDKNWSEGLRELSPYLHEEEDLLHNRLRQLGYTEDDVKIVIISHLHNDHAGSLYKYKKSTVYVHEDELRTTVYNYVTNGPLDVHERSDIKAIIDAELTWRPVKADEKELEVLPGLKILSLGSGHSWGMLALSADLENTGNVLLVADALYTSDNYGPPLHMPGIVYDTLGYARTAEAIREYAEAHNSMIIFGHDIDQFETLKKAPEAYYD